MGNGAAAPEEAAAGAVALGGALDGAVSGAADAIDASATAGDGAVRVIGVAVTAGSAADSAAGDTAFVASCAVRAGFAAGLSVGALPCLTRATSTPRAAPNRMATPPDRISRDSPRR
jgi:hypothetical protein